MIVTVCQYKGGVAKSTTAVHLATYFQTKAPTVLVDGDPNRSVFGWATNGKLPFEVIHLNQTARLARQYDHVIIDTNARPEPEVMKELLDGCDLLVLPCTPDALSLQSLYMTIGAIKQIGGGNYKVLLTIVPHKKWQAEMRGELESKGVPVFQGAIRRFIAYQKAALAGTPVYAVDDPKAAEAWNDYLNVAKEILP